MLPCTHDYICDRDLSGTLQRLAQERVDLLAALLRSHPVGSLVVFGSYVRRLSEARNLDRLGCLRIGLAEVLVRQSDVLALLVLVAAHNIFPLDELAGALVVALVTNRREVALVEKVQVDRRAMGCGVQLDRDIDESERDGAFPE